MLMIVLMSETLVSRRRRSIADQKPFLSDSLSFVASAAQRVVAAMGVSESSERSWLAGPGAAGGSL